MKITRAALVACVVAVAGTSAKAQEVASLGVPLPEAPTVAAPAQTNELTLRKLPLRFLHDEAAIVTSPARLRKGDLVWLLPLAGASATAFATDSYTMRHVVSRDPSFNDAAATTSDVLRDSAIGVPVLMFAAGQLRGDAKTRETGLLAGEAILDAYVFSEGVKYVTLRERPLTDNANGHFFRGSAAGDPSFISGHSVVAWSSAAVLAEAYTKPWQQVGLYALASGVSLTRVLGQQHFPSDSLLGSAAGWLIGHYVYRAHHRDYAAAKTKTARHRQALPEERSEYPPSLGW